MTLPTCPCGKLIDVGPTCPSCAPAYRAGMLRAAEIAYNTAAPKSIGYDKGRHHMAGAQHAGDAIRKEAATVKTNTQPKEDPHAT